MSTTTVLDPRRDKISVSQEELLIHEMKKISDHPISPPLTNQRQRLSSGQAKRHDLYDYRDKFSKHLHKIVAQTRFFTKNSTTHYQKVIFTW